ncbi:MAG: ATP-binding protein [Deltaproteobacteria bacterium]|nr:ATP-binding protein [Deltaproteobacteria bacterium]
MSDVPIDATGENDARPDRTSTFKHFVDRVLDWTRTDLTRAEYLDNVCRLLARMLRCDVVELRVLDHGQIIRARRSESHARATIDLFRSARDERGKSLAVIDGDIELFADLAGGRFDPSSPIFTSTGALRLDARAHDDAWLPDADRERLPTGPDGPFAAVAWIPMSLDGKHLGFLHAAWRDAPDSFAAAVEFAGELASTFARCLGQRRGVVALRERVKELECLYAISRLIEQRETTADDILRQVADILPPAWQYPEIATARIALDDAVFTSAPFAEGPGTLRSDIWVAGRKRGFVEVIYTNERPALDEGPFLREERHLLDVVARQIALVVEERQARAERTSLHDQLAHSDRLATIGQIAAGMAHELNQPLGNILGFAQLARKSVDLPADAVADIERIVKAALHMREVVRKLLIFARKAPIHRVPASPNAAVEEALFFLEWSCSREGVSVVRRLADDLPNVLGDPAQLRQIVVNLVMNAVQAMPGGGTVFVETRRDRDGVMLAVQDTGHGMSDEDLARVFEPFFTTKAENEGTGLGLAVVQGIVQSHDGTIRVESREGAGTRFEIHLPTERRSKRRNGT